VALLTAQLRWEAPATDHAGRWLVRFRSVPPPRFYDELMLAIYSPLGIHVFRYNGTAEEGIVRRAFKNGGELNAYGSIWEHGWYPALELSIVPSIVELGFDLLDLVSFNHSIFKAVAHNFDELRGAVTPSPLAEGDAARSLIGSKDSAQPPCIAAIYEGVPLSGHNPVSRASTLVQLALAVDSILHPRALFTQSQIVPRDRVTASQRKSWSLDCSWRRSGMPVICRAAQLLWEKSNRRWRLLFSSIKLPNSDATASDMKRAGNSTAAAHDGIELDQAPAISSDPFFGFEVQLAIYCPRGVYIYRHNGKLGLTRTGKVTNMAGYQIKLHGPVGETDCNRALENTILPMLDDSEGCKRIAFVDWST